MSVGNAEKRAQIPELSLAIRNGGNHICTSPSTLKLRGSPSIRLPHLLSQFVDLPIMLQICVLPQQVHRHLESQEGASGSRYCTNICRRNPTEKSARAFFSVDSSEGFANVSHAIQRGCRVLHSTLDDVYRHLLAPVVLLTCKSHRMGSKLSNMRYRQWHQPSRWPTLVALGLPVHVIHVYGHASFAC